MKNENLLFDWKKILFIWKKRKMLLKAIAGMAVGCGALAFKAPKGYDAIIYINDELGRCLVAVSHFSGNTASPNTFASPQPTALPCPPSKSISFPLLEHSNKNNYKLLYRLKILGQDRLRHSDQVTQDTPGKISSS